MVDIYRGERQALRNPVSFVTYIAMFPQLVAGPIVRYREIADQLPQHRSHRLDDIAAGFPPVRARACARRSSSPTRWRPWWTPASPPEPDQMTFAVAWLGALGYTLQLYFDFSGYSDMAIGLGRMLGFRLPENFARPYSSVTITEFWRRWHMSLSRWFRDYVYIPLGGNRHGPAKTYRNLFIVFVLTGFWHGAELDVPRLGPVPRRPADHRTRLQTRERTNHGPRTNRPTRTHHGPSRIRLGVLQLRRPGNALAMVGHMLLPDFQGLTDVVETALTNQRLLILIAALGIMLLPAQPVTGPLLESSRSATATIMRVTIMTIGLAYSAILVATGTFSPFLYYQF